MKNGQVRNAFTWRNVSTCRVPVTVFSVNGCVIYAVSHYALILGIFSTNIHEINLTSAVQKHRKIWHRRYKFEYEYKYVLQLYGNAVLHILHKTMQLFNSETATLYIFYVMVFLVWYFYCNLICAWELQCFALFLFPLRMFIVCLIYVPKKPKHIPCKWKSTW